MQHSQQNRTSRFVSILMLMIGFVVAGCLASRPAGLMNSVQFASNNRDAVWERIVTVLNVNHFQIARESKLEGLIETEYRTGANLFEPWHPDSVGAASRLESTLQSIRRRLIVMVQSSSPGMINVTVRAEKEIEDLPGLAANHEGGATFPEARPLKRDLTQVIGQSAPSRWLPLGRDPDLETRIIHQIRSAGMR